MDRGIDEREERESVIPEEQVSRVLAPEIGRQGVNGRNSRASVKAWERSVCAGARDTETEAAASS